MSMLLEIVPGVVFLYEGEHYTRTGGKRENEFQIVRCVWVAENWRVVSEGKPSDYLWLPGETEVKIKALVKWKN